MSDFLSTWVRPWLWTLLLLVAAVHFLFVDVASVLPRIDLPDGLTGIVAKVEDLRPFLRNVTLLSAALFMVFLLPSRVRAAKERRLERVLVVAGLALLALATVRRVTDAAALVVVQQITLVATLGIAAVVVARSSRAAFDRIPVVVFLTTFAIPPLLRLAFEWQDGETIEGSTLASLRDIGDGIALVGLASVAVRWIAPAGPTQLVALAGGALALTVAVSAWSAVVELVQAGLDLWIAGLARWIATPVLAAGAFVVMRAIAATVRGRADTGLAAAVILLVAAGFLPLRSEETLLVYIGAVASVAWARGTCETTEDRDALVA